MIPVMDTNDVKHQIDAFDGDDLDTVQALTDIAKHAQSARDEAMARAVTAGHSLRSVAAAAQVVPNTAASALAHTQSLGQYAVRGRVGSTGIGAARHEAMTFQRRENR